MYIITLERCVREFGRPNDLSIEENESPMMIEYAKQAKNVLNVITDEITTADFGPKVLDQASENVFAP